jgi:hypothetical protein
MVASRDLYEANCKNHTCIAGIDSTLQFLYMFSIYRTVIIVIECGKCNIINAVSKFTRWVVAYFIINVSSLRSPLWSSGEILDYSSRGPDSIPCATRFSEK